MTEPAGIVELRAVVRVGEEMADAVRIARIKKIQERLDAAPGTTWFAHDCRRSAQNGQIRIHARDIPLSARTDHVANVLARGPEPAATADLIGNAPADLLWLLDEVSRLRKKLGNRLYQPDET